MTATAVAVGPRPSWSQVLWPRRSWVAPDSRASARGLWDTTPAERGMRPFETVDQYAIVAPRHVADALELLERRPCPRTARGRVRNLGPRLALPASELHHPR